MNDAEVKLQVKIDSNEAEKAVKSLSDKTKELGSKFTSAGKALTVGLTLPITALIGAGVKYNAEMEQYQAGLETMLGSTEKANAMLAELKKMAASTPFETTDLIKASQTLLAFGLDANKTTDYLQMLGDVSMGNAEKFGSLTLAFAQVQSTGRLMGQDLLQMIGQGFNPLQIISEKTGRSMADLKKDMENGAISADMVTEAFKDATSEGGRFYKAMDKQSKTTEGKISTLKDSFNNMAGALTENLGPAITNIVDGLTGLFSWFGSLDTNTQTFILTVLGLTAAIGPLLIGIGSLTTALTVLSANPVVLIIAGIIAIIGGLVFAIWYAYDNWEAFSTGFIAIAKGLVGIITDTFWNAVTFIMNLLTNLGNFIVGAWRGFGDSIIWAMTRVGDTVRWIFSGIGDFVWWIFKGMVNTIFGVLNNLIWGLNFAIYLAMIPINAMIAALNQIPGVYIPYANFAIPYIPKLKTGTNYTQEGLHYLHEGEAVVPKKYNPAAGGGMGQVVYMDMPDIYMDSNKVGKAITPSIARTLRLVGAR